MKFYGTVNEILVDPSSSKIVGIVVALNFSEGLYKIPLPIPTEQSYEPKVGDIIEFTAKPQRPI